MRAPLRARILTTKSRFDPATAPGERPAPFVCFAPDKDSVRTDKEFSLMNIHQDVTLDRVTDAVQRSHTTLDNPGLCIRRGAEADGVEPDARRYECEFLR